MSNDVSVLTIASGRAAHLANVIRGLGVQDRAPAELVIAVMQDEFYEGLPDAGFPVRQVMVPHDGRLPLAAARNAAARAAEAEVLAFVDVDCIPGPGFVADYARAVAKHGGLHMGEVGYLPEGATAKGIDFHAFEAVADRHPDRQAPPKGGIGPCTDYRCFWSLTFALSSADFSRLGGFDERYVGYGGEDTDFGRKIEEARLPLHWIAGAKVYHQYHPHFMPPIHHVETVVRNAELFRQKWGHRTMGHWLYAFEKMGLIDVTPERIEILRDPSEEDMALCRQQSDMPFATTRRVLDLLDAREGTLPEEKTRRKDVAAAQARLIGAAS
jgi:GT2 family glycosyltransferase